MSNVIYTNFGNIGQIQPAVITYVNQAVRDATQNSVQQSGTSTVNAIPKYVSDNTIQSTNVLINEFDDLSVGGGVEIGTNGVGNSYFLPLGRSNAGDYVIQFDGVGNTSFVTAGAPVVPPFINTLTVQNLSQGTSALLQNYVLPTTIPPNDNQTYTLTAQNLQANPIGGISLLAVTTFRFQAFDANLLNPFFIEYVINNGYYSINEFLARNQQLMDLAIGRQTSIIFNAQFTYDTPTQKFGFAIGVQSQNFGRLLSIAGFNGHVVLGGQVAGDEPFFPLTAPPQYFPNATPNLVFGTDNILKWKVAPFAQNSIISNDGSASVICEDVGIGGNLISSNANWNMGLGDLNNVGSISSTAETLTSTCGQSQLQLASIADGTSQSNTTYLSSGSGITNTAFVTTTDIASIVRDGGTGTVFRVSVDADIKLKDQNNNDRLLIETVSGYTSLRSGNGTADRFDIDGLGAYISVGGQAVFYANPTNTDTRIWSPDGSKQIGIEDLNGIKINSAYYLPTADGGPSQVMTTNGTGQASWQTPQILGFYSQTSPVTVVSTAVQTSIIGAGVGSLSVNANYFTIGMGFTYRTGGLFGALNNATIRFRLTNSGTLFDSGLLQFSPAIASGRPWNIDVTFIYIGGTTMITNFNFQYNNGSDARGFTAQNTNNTFNPAIVNTLNFTAEWGASSASNTITTNYGILTKIY